MSYPWLHDTSLHLDLHGLFQDKATSRQMTVLYYEVVDDRRGGNGGQTVEVDDEGTRAVTAFFPVWEQRVPPRLLLSIRCRRGGDRMDLRWAAPRT
jgi:hypothetical protein